SIPLAHGPVGHGDGIVGVFLIVVQAAGADRIVPDLHLGIAAQVKAAVALGTDFPISPQLEVAVILGGLQTLTLAVVMQNAVLDSPVRQILLIGFLLFFRQLLG